MTPTIAPSIVPSATVPQPSATATSVVFAAASSEGARDAATIEEAIYTQINELRAQNGLPPLAYNAVLAAAAREHSCDIAARHAIDHNAADGRTLAQRLPPSDRPWEWPSENIAAGFPDATAVVQAWFDEAPPDDWHRRNILASDQREVGIGYCYNDDPNSGNDHYYTADFARRTDVYPLVVANGARRTSERSVAYWLYGSGWAESMRLGFTPDLGAMSWLPFASSGSYQLDGAPGPYTLYAELRDPIGTTQVVSATIILE